MNNETQSANDEDTPQVRAQAPAKKAFEAPAMEKLDVMLTEATVNPGSGSDFGIYS